MPIGLPVATPDAEPWPRRHQQKDKRQCNVTGHDSDQPMVRNGDTVAQPDAVVNERQDDYRSELRAEIANIGMPKADVASKPHQNTYGNQTVRATSSRERQYGGTTKQPSPQPRSR